MKDKLLRAFMASQEPEETMYHQIITLIKKRVESFQSNKKQKKLPRTKLKLLLAGYAGAGNTGSDIRTFEMIRQFQAILGKKNLHLTLMVMSKSFAGETFNHVNIAAPQYTPSFLFKEVAKHHGVIACEGSLFKSNFSPILSLNMLSAMGLALSENKIAIAYGAEAGWMDEKVKQFSQDYCKNALAICRNPQSQAILTSLGLRVAPGADPAWTFEPHNTTNTYSLLRESGWDGKKRIIAICPMNPFWWPVRADPERAKQTKANMKEQYHKSIFFHAQSEEIEKKYKHYLSELAKAIHALCKKYRLFPIIVGMERVDYPACEDLRNQLSFKNKIPIFLNGQWNMHDIVKLLRHARYLISSRFHAIVTAISNDVIPIGIAMDERIENLLINLGHPELILKANEIELSEKLLHLFASRDEYTIKKSIKIMLKTQLKALGEMGMILREEIQNGVPTFSLPPLSPHWRAHLPPLSNYLNQLLD